MAACRAAFHWSGGKDSTLALSVLLAAGEVVVDTLVTTTNPDATESTVHGVPVELLAAQARSIGIALELVPMSGTGLDGYSTAMLQVATRMRRQGIGAFAFGDLDCSGARRIRQEQFASTGLEVLEPLQGMSSRECIDAYLRSGFQAITVVVDARVLGPADVGVPLDRQFIHRLPVGVDPCGEFGEYHSFVHDGPLFREPVRFGVAPPCRVEHRIGTTDGERGFAYWVSRLQPTPR